MKKLYTLLMMAMMGVMAVSLTSCDDEQIAYTLEGTWRGSMHIEDWNGVSYVESEITFLKDPYRYSEGSGLWVDYYYGGRYVPTHFNWRVDYGDIRIYFVEDDAEVLIRRYSLNNNYFSGEFYDGNKTVSFNLQNVARRYERDYRWDSYYGWTRSADGDSITVSRPAKRIK
jgi:hypothetical protein